MASFQGAEIGRLPREAIGDVRQVDPVIDCCRTGLQPEIEVFGLVEVLYGLDILGVKSADTDEDVVIQCDTVLILFGCLTVFGKRAEAADLQ